MKSIGWIIASIIKGVVKKILNSTAIDNKIAEAVTGQRGTSSSTPEEAVGGFLAVEEIGVLMVYSIDV